MTKFEVFAKITAGCEAVVDCFGIRYPITDSRGLRALENLFGQPAKRDKDWGAHYTGEDMKMYHFDLFETVPTGAIYMFPEAYVLIPFKDQAERERNGNPM